MSNFISTVSGRRFYFDCIEDNVAHLADIGHALGNICRFTGQCFEFYSVAEHSVHVSYLVPPELALVGLLHDATEAYCNDIAKPLKNYLPDYERIEDRVWRVIAKQFGMPDKLPPEVKAADMAMLKREIGLLLPPHCLEELDLPGDPAPVNLSVWQPREARFFFRQRLMELTA